jgi:hypothetical protein
MVLFAAIAVRISEPNKIQVVITKLSAGTEEKHEQFRQDESF